MEILAGTGKAGFLAQVQAMTIELESQLPRAIFKNKHKVRKTTCHLADDDVWGETNSEPDF